MARTPDDKTVQDSYDKSLGLGRNNAEPIDTIMAAFLSVPAGDQTAGADFFDRFAAYNPAPGPGGEGPNANLGITDLQIDPRVTEDTTIPRRSLSSSELNDANNESRSNAPGSGMAAIKKITNNVKLDVSLPNIIDESISASANLGGFRFSATKDTRRGDHSVNISRGNWELSHHSDPDTKRPGAGPRDEYGGGQTQLRFQKRF